MKTATMTRNRANLFLASPASTSPMYEKYAPNTTTSETNEIHALFSRKDISALIRWCQRFLTSHGASCQENLTPWPHLLVLSFCRNTDAVTSENPLRPARG